MNPKPEAPDDLCDDFLHTKTFVTGLAEATSYYSLPDEIFQCSCGVKFGWQKIRLKMLRVIDLCGVLPEKPKAEDFDKVRALVERVVRRDGDVRVEYPTDDLQASLQVRQAYVNFIHVLKSEVSFCDGINERMDRMFTKWQSGRPADAIGELCSVESKDYELAEQLTLVRLQAKEDPLSRCSHVHVSEPADLRLASRPHDLHELQAVSLRSSLSKELIQVACDAVRAGFKNVARRGYTRCIVAFVAIDQDPAEFQPPLGSYFHYLTRFSFPLHTTLIDSLCSHESHRAQLVRAVSAATGMDVTCTLVHCKNPSSVVDGVRQRKPFLQCNITGDWSDKAKALENEKEVTAPV